MHLRAMVNECCSMLRCILNLLQDSQSTFLPLADCLYDCPSLECARDTCCALRLGGHLAATPCSAKDEEQGLPHPTDPDQAEAEVLEVLLKKVLSESLDRTMGKLEV